MSTKQSGSGWRTTFMIDGEPAVSIWAYTPDDAENMAHMENMRHMEAMEAERVTLELAFAAQQREAHRKIRVRA